MAIDLVVQPGEDIQTYIDIAESLGGGSVLMNIGTFTPGDDLMIPTNVSFGGLSRSACIIDFLGAAHSIKSIGTSLDPKGNVSIENMTVINSADSGVYFEYVNNSQIDGLDVFDCLYGYYATNCAATGLLGQGGFMSNCGTGIRLEDSSATSIYFTSIAGNTGNGLEMVGCSALTVFDVGFDENGGNGVSLTDCSGMAFVSTEALDNTGVGIELISGNSQIQFSATPIQGNGSDGFKMTDSNNNITLNSCVFDNNSGYGVNIANANCNDNLLVSNQFLTNTLGEVNDLGTGTLIRSNVGVVDN